jgi:hypothetical protein
VAVVVAEKAVAVAVLVVINLASALNSLENLVLHLALAL